MKKALVLAGGGTKGAYQAGAIRALLELKENDFDIVTGTSVGALNAAMLVQGDYEALFDLFENLSVDQIINGMSPAEIGLKTLLNDREGVKKEVIQYIKERGLDISPFLSKVDELYHPEQFFASKVDFGCIVATHRGHSPVYVTKDMMKENGADWLVASASAYPAFPLKVIDGNEYVDGGYFDNCPIDFALRLGAEQVLVLDLNVEPNHPQYIRRSNVRYIFPKGEMGDFLDFSTERLQSLSKRGYQDVMKEFGRYVGYQYTFEPFRMPGFFSTWYRELELLETNIKLAGNINEKLRSDSFITYTLKAKMHLTYLNDSDYFYGMLDAAMRLIGADENRVYTIGEVQKMLEEQFAEYMQEKFGYKTLLSLAQIPLISNALNTRAVIGRMIHTNLFAEHTILSESTVLTVYPFEKALADFITYLLKEKI